MNITWKPRKSSEKSALSKWDEWVPLRIDGDKILIEPKGVKNEARWISLEQVECTND